MDESSEKYIELYMKDATVLHDKFTALDFAWDNISINGLICEFGVYSGLTVNYIAAKTDDTVHGFDSFEGLPEDWREDFPKGKFALDTLPYVLENVQLHKGWFDDTLPEFLNDHQQPMSFIHIDCDLYSSTKTVLNLCKDRILPKTVIVFDEYFNYPDWENGEHKAFQEFVQENNLKYRYLCYNSQHEQVAVVIEL